MAAFLFEACDRSGGRHAGLLDAESLTSATAVLRARGWIVLSMRAGATRADGEAADGLPQRTWNPMTWLPPAKIDVEMSLQQIASMLRSGMTLLSALKTAAEQSRRPSMGKIWSQISEAIQEGGTFAGALAKYPRCFPDFVVQLVKVGEASGTLDVVLARASEQLERSRTLKFILLNALLYPLIVMVMAVAVTAYMMIVLIPKLQKFLAGRNKRLPAVTQALLDVSNWVQAYIPHIAVGMVVAAVAFWMIRRWPPGRLKLDAWALRIPLIGRILRTAATAAFARTLGMLLESGITLVTGLGVVQELLGNKAFARHVAEVRETVMGGGTLSTLLTRRRMFMPMLGRVAAVGEATGTLDAVLAETALFHEKQLAATVRWLSVIVEPVIIVVVGGIVGFVYISFFVALYSIAG